jgi:prepilin-type N-terminal cleavage/methylation domain-containing protein
MKQRGFTLVEMVAVISVSSVLLMLATGVVHRAMRLDTAWREQADLARAMARLTHDVRRDAHQAQSVVITQNPLVLRMVLAGSAKVNYQVAGERIIRERQIAGEQTEHEYYKKPADYRLEITTLASPERVELILTHDVKLVGVAPRAMLHVEAEVGRLLRLAREQGGAP